ncbi:hypothetical protein [Microbacterium aurum]
MTKPHSNTKSPHVPILILSATGVILGVMMLFFAVLFNRVHDAELRVLQATRATQMQLLELEHRLTDGVATEE